MHGHRVNRGKISEDEQGYTVTEDEQGYTVTGRTEVKSQDEQGYTVTGRTAVKKSEVAHGYTVTG